LIFDDHLRFFEFLGKVIGKALFSSILVDVPFAHFFIMKLIGKNSHVHDLVYLDPQLHENLMKLKYWKGNVQEDFGLTFSVDDNALGKVVVHELIPNGNSIPVTEENRLIYIHHMASYRLNIQIKRQAEAFRRGFSLLIKPTWLSVFNHHELQQLISGDSAELDVTDLRKNTVYGPGYSDSHPAIQCFWQVVSNFTPQQQRNLLKFVTSCPRPPLLGFSYLNPKFGIQQSFDMDHLPTASTCINLLKLAPYTDTKVMRDKLLYAIESQAGFDLS